MKRHYPQYLFAVLTAALLLDQPGRAQAPVAPALQNLNAAQQAVFDNLDLALTTAVAAARADLVTASLAEAPTAASLSAQAAALAAAEQNLANARGEALIRLQNSANRLGSAQIATLARQAAAGRGGRGGPAANPATTPPAAPVAIPPETVEAPAVAGLIPAGSESIRYMGRWEKRSDAAITVNSGSALRFRFNGPTLKAYFKAVAAAPQLYVAFDGGAKTMLNVNAAELDLAPGGLANGPHTVEIEVKDVNQNSNRWTPPLQSALIFLGFGLAPGGAALDPVPVLTGRWAPDALRIEFYGDSITEGVRALGMATTPDGSDGTKTYSYLTGLAFGANITQVGFGAQAIMRGGGGGVPAASVAFGSNYAGALRDPRTPPPQVVVINQGTNDSGTSPVQFEPTYLAFLKQVRAAFPGALIAAMRPFNGSQDAAIYSAVRTMNDPRVIYIDTDGWLALMNSPDYTEQPTGLHPSLIGHAKAAEHLVAALRAAGVGAGAATAK